MCTGNGMIAEQRAAPPWPTCPRDTVVVDDGRHRGSGVPAAAEPILPPPSPPPGIVVEGARVPDWVTAWCRRSGRPLMVGAGPVSTTSLLADASVLVLRPVLATLPVPQVVAVVGELPGDRAVLAEAAAAASHLAASLVLVHGVPRSFGERSVGLDAALDQGEHVLRQAWDAVAVTYPGLTVRTELRRAWPHELVGEEVDADLLVVGQARHQPGLVALSAVHHAPCPVLLVSRPRAA